MTARYLIDDMKFIFQIAFATVMFILPAQLCATATPQSAPNISVNGSFASDKVARGRTVQGTVVMDIPSGFHTHSNRPLEKFLIATELKVEAPRGMRVGPTLYPRALLRSLKFSKNKVSVFEGRTTMRFNVTIPASAATGSTEIKGRLRYQSCNDDACFPPQTREVKMWLNVQ
jgi:hypothetical protein